MTTSKCMARATRTRTRTKRRMMTMQGMETPGTHLHRLIRLMAIQCILLMVSLPLIRCRSCRGSWSKC